jgi:Protein of unknown function (DUF3341)
MGHHAPPNPVFGVVARFATSDDVTHAAHEARKRGYQAMDAYSPVPVHGLDEALGRPRSWLAWIVFAAACTGFSVGLGLQYWVSAVEYPLNIGGRPLFSWPLFIPVVFECTVLFSCFTAVFGMFALNGLPKPYNPIFYARDFDRASLDRYFLCIEAKDALFNEKDVTEFLRSLKPEDVSTVVIPENP